LDPIHKVQFDDGTEYYNEEGRDDDSSNQYLKETEVLAVGAASDTTATAVTASTNAPQFASSVDALRAVSQVTSMTQQVIVWQEMAQKELQEDTPLHCGP
jgi:hypothetical protein